MNMSQSMGSQS